MPKRARVVVWKGAHQPKNTPDHVNKNRTARLKNLGKMALIVYIINFALKILCKIKNKNKLA